MGQRKPNNIILRQLAESLIMRQQIETTGKRAKELRPFIERWITKARKNSVARRRLVAREFGAPAVRKLFAEIAPRFRQRPGGYTRIIKKPSRKGDAAARAIIQFVE